MKYTEACIKAVEDYTDGMAEYESKRAEIERAFRADEIGSATYQRRREELLGIDGKLLAQMVKTINDARDAYIADLPRRYRRDSETMDAADLELLTSGTANLSADDVQSMFEKHAGSLGMQGAIVEANAKREDPASITYYSQQMRKEDAIAFAESMVSAARAGGMRAAMAIEGRYIPASLAGE